LTLLKHLAGLCPIRISWLLFIYITEKDMEQLELLFTNLPVWISMALTLVGAVSAITAVTPTKSDDEIVNAVLRVLNILSLNIGKNKNADDQ
jgi:hypothetical protein